MEEKSLKDKTASGLGWSAIDKLMQNFFVLVCGILLARTIDQSGYGLMGLLAIFVGLANLLQESGFTSALIRKKDILKDDYKTVFYINISIGLFLYIILFFAAPLISSFYNKPELTDLARFLFLSFLFNSFAVVQNAKLIKEINYKLLAKINSTSMFLSYVIALYLAYKGYGAWALASQVVAVTFFKMSGLWLFSKWKPEGSFSKISFKELTSFSSKMLAGGIINSVMINLPQNVIGQYYSINITGLYSQAFKNFNAANDLLTGSLHNVSYPVLSSIGLDDKDRLKKAFRKFTRIKAFAVFPLFIGIALVARPFMHLLGDQWADAAPILQLLCLGGIFMSLETINSDILRIKGKSGTILWLTIFQAVMILTAIIGPHLLHLDYLYYVLGISISYIIRYTISSLIATPMIGYKLSELFKDMTPYAIVTILSIAIGYTLKYVIDNQIILLVSQIAIVGVLYIGILYFSGSKILREAVEYIKPK